MLKAVSYIGQVLEGRSVLGFRSAIVITLSLVIAASGAALCFFDGYLFRPLPFYESDRIYSVRDDSRKDAAALTAADVKTLRQSDLRSYGFVDWEISGLYEATILGTSRSALAYKVSPGFRNVVGLELFAGRDFSNADHEAAAPAACWLSYRFWVSALGASREVLGQEIHFQRSGRLTPLTVVGILGPTVTSFDPNNPLPDLVLPASTQVHSSPDRLAFPLIKLARFDDVQALEQRIAARLESAGFESGDKRSIRLVSLRRMQTAGGAPTATLLLISACLILCLGIVSALQLVVARCVARLDELSVRQALGATPRHLAFAVMREIAPLGIISIPVGLLLAKVMSAELAALVPSMPTSGRHLGLVPVIFDQRIVALIVGTGIAIVMICVAVAVLFAVTAVTRQKGSALQRFAKGAGTLTLMRSLLAIEIATATTMLFATLFVGSGIFRYLNQELGFEFRDRVRVSFLEYGAARPSGGRGEQLRLIRELPSVTAAAFQPVPLGASAMNFGDGFRQTRSVEQVIVCDGYFEAVGVQPLVGRLFSDSDYSRREPVAIVDLSVATDLSQESIGEQVTFAGSLPRSIVGVLRPIRTHLERETPATVYVPGSGPDCAGSLVAWIPGDDRVAVHASVTRVLRPSFDGRIDVVDLSLETLYPRAVGEAYFQLPILVCLGLLAVLLASWGMLGLLTYALQLRRRDFAIRAALGASPTQLRRAAYVEIMRPTVIGTVAGLLVASGAEALVEASVFGWTPNGMVTSAAVLATVMAMALIVGHAPARRAAAADPAMCLRQP